MPRLPDSAVLELWERGAAEHPLDRALTLIAFLDGKARREALAALPIAERDRRLFALAEALFGPQLAVTAVCTACGAETELTFAASEVAALEAPADSRLVFRRDGRDHPYRAPDSRDLAAALRAPDDAAARRRLLLSLFDGAAPDDDDFLSDFDAELGRVAGLEALRLSFDCAECGEGQAAPFDILDHVWTRIAAEARRIMWDIHLLARSYGWTSGEILGLSPLRRAEHVAMVMA